MELTKPRGLWARGGAAVMAAVVVLAGAACSRTAPTQGAGHLPPIECPLHKAGVDAAKLEPFDKTEKYIQHLERPERAKWQKPAEVVAALGLRGTETVVDLGAGSGYFTFLFARAVPKGKVFALDVQPEMIRHIHHKVMSEGISNIEARVAKPDDPGIPAGTDVVFVCDVLHHVANRAEWLRKIYAEMPGGARLVLIEFKMGPLPQGPPDVMKIPKAQLIAMLREAGFTLAEDRPDILPYQEFLVFVKARP